MDIVLSFYAIDLFAQDIEYTLHIHLQLIAHESFHDIQHFSSIMGVFGWREWRSRIKIKMDVFHSNRLVGRSPISISK